MKLFKCLVSSFKLISLVCCFSIVAYSSVAISAPETYSATVDDGTLREIRDITNIEDVNLYPNISENRQGPNEDSRIDARISTDRVKVLLAPTKNTHSDKKIMQKVDSNVDFVSQDKVPEIAERIKFTYEILKKHGYAYDYKLTTLQALKDTLKKLDAKETALKNKTTVNTKPEITKPDPSSMNALTKDNSNSSDATLDSVSTL